MRSLKLWFSFLLVVIAAIFVTFFIGVFLVFAFFQFSHNSPDLPVTWLPFLVLGLTSSLISLAIMLVVSRRFFIPIEQVITAIKQVAAGDFNVLLPETGVVDELYDMNVNFNKMVRELNSIEMLQSDFIQNVSHEFKTPLASIEGYATLLNGASLPEELHGYTTRILESTKQLSSLTGNILRLSKLENQQIVSEKTRFSLDEQLRQAILSLEPIWSKKNLDIDIDLPEIQYYGNEDLLYQVWTNLFSNAIKFTPRGGFISATVKKDYQGVTVEITDNGIGMSEEIQARVFDKFYQGERNRNIEGNGLGLALVKKIIALCNGMIYVRSRPNEGSTFIVWLPFGDRPSLPVQ